MCGIFGVWNLHKQSIELDVFIDSLNSIRHRGPDDEGYLLIDSRAGEVASCLGPDSAANINLPRVEQAYSPRFDMAFGYRRLSILDLSPAGHQPMSNADGSLWIVFNGEIYNYIELRAELQTLGYVFHTQSDTEVIINAYDAWGVDCLKRFNGMWGLALFDKRKNRLFCARDRFGIKPFYYHFDGERLIFGSEIKAVLSYSKIKRRPNDAIVYDYLCYGLLDHTNETFYEGITQLAPAHYLVLEGQNITIERYWNIDPANKFDIGAGSKADVEYSRRFYELFEDSVRIHLRSDVAVGSCLSGGIDSSSIVSVIKNLLVSEKVVSPESIGEIQKTFSVCFDDPRFDERQHIEKVLEATLAERNYTFPTPQNLVDDLPRLIWHQDEPFGSISMFAQWRVMKIAAERGMRVLLDGQGGDEILAGYIPFYDSHWGTLLAQGRPGNLLHEWSTYRQIHHASYTYLLQHTLFPLMPLMYKRSVRFNRGRIGLQNDFASKFQRRYPDESIAYQGDPLSERLYHNLMYTSLPGLLHYEDRSSMAYSIEARVPFLDYRLVEYAFSLPGHQKINNSLTKSVLRNSMHGIVPDQILNRTDKMGFVTPEKVWLSTDLKDWVDDIINSETFRTSPYMDVAQVKTLLDEHRAHKRDLEFRLWKWINLHLWLDQLVNSQN